MIRVEKKRHPGRSAVDWALAAMICFTAAGPVRDAIAETPYPNPEFLARIDATQSFCSRQEPKKSAANAAFAAALAGQMSVEELKEARKSDEYRKAFDSATDELAKAGPDQAKRICGDASKSL
jgi:hypothetical protein